MPRLPYAPDFKKIPDGAVPGGWVNTRASSWSRSLKDGNKVLAKVNTNPNPLFARGNAFIGMPTMKDYTIECDVLGTKVQCKNAEGMNERSRRKWASAPTATRC